MLELAWKNVTRRKNRAAIAVIITTITIFVSTIVWNVFSITKSGIDLSQERMGADILICPEGITGDDQNYLFTGSAEMAYMDEQELMRELPEDYIENVTNEFYLETLPDGGCCSTDFVYRIVGIDSEKDFLIKPWLEKENIADFSSDDIIIGSDVKMDYGRETTVLATQFNVKGLLYKTGTGLDQSLIVDIGKARELAEINFDSGVFNEKSTEKLISSCFIKLKEGVSAEEFLKKFNAKKLGVKVITVSKTRGQLRQQNNDLVEILGVFWTSVLVISAIALFSQYHGMIKERKCETGYLRAIGMTKNSIVLSNLIEVCIQGITGGIIGGILGCIAFYPVLEKIQRVFVIPSGEWAMEDNVLHILGGVGVALVISIIAAIIPSVQNAGIDPQTALTEGELE